MNKVLVGTVTNQCKDYCWDKFAKQLKGLQMQGHDEFCTTTPKEYVERKLKQL